MNTMLPKTQEFHGGVTYGRRVASGGILMIILGLDGRVIGNRVDSNGRAYCGLAKLARILSLEEMQ